MEIAEVRIQIVHDTTSSMTRSGARWSAKVGDRWLTPDSEVTLYTAEEAFAAALDAVERHLDRRVAASSSALVEFRRACAVGDVSQDYDPDQDYRYPLPDEDDDDIEGVPA